MSTDDSRGTPKGTKGRAGKPARPNDLHGLPSKGRIVSIMVGQGHGYIRSSAGREVFFHRADLDDGMSFNSLDVGDSVTFELLDDRVSGARALRVRRS